MSVGKACRSLATNQHIMRDRVNYDPTILSVRVQHKYASLRRSTQLVIWRHVNFGKFSVGCSLNFLTFLTF